MLKQFFFGPCCLMHSSVYCNRSIFFVQIWKGKHRNFSFLSCLCRGPRYTALHTNNISKDIVAGPILPAAHLWGNLSNILPNSHIGPRNSPLPIYCSVSSIGLKVLRGSGHTDTRGPKKTTTLDRANSKIRHSWVIHASKKGMVLVLQNLSSLFNKIDW